MSVPARAIRLLLIGGVAAMAALAGDGARAGGRPQAVADDRRGGGLPTGLDANGHVCALVAANAPGFAHVRLRNGVQVAVNGMVKTILFYGPATVRVNTNLGRNYWTTKSIVVIAPPAPVPFALADGATALSVTTAGLRLSIDKRTGAVSFADAAGRPYTREDAAAPQSVRPVTVSGAPSHAVENRFTLRPDEAIFASSAKPKP